MCNPLEYIDKKLNIYIYYIVNKTTILIKDDYYYSVIYIVKYSYMIIYV